MQFIVTYERFTLKVLSVTKVNTRITDADVLCDEDYKTLITNDSEAVYTDAVGEMYLYRKFTRGWRDKL